MKHDSLQPRLLRYRSNIKMYSVIFIFLTLTLFIFWMSNFQKTDPFTNQSEELILLGCYLFLTVSFYLFWLRPRMNKYVQVFEDHLLICRGKEKELVKFSDIESVNFVCWSIFYVKMKSGLKHYFHSRYERVDYVWEGIYQSCPNLISSEVFNSFRIKLVQYDHYQKRKEWFFKHKVIDVINWIVLPMLFIGISFILQSKDILIHQQEVYFFRLFMYSMLVLLVTSFIFTLLLKKLVFDKKVTSQIESFEIKTRDVEFEGELLHRTKIFQSLTAVFTLALLIKVDLNLFSVTKINHEIANLKVKRGSTIIIDNRYNCINCKYRLHDGDFVVFGKGVIGQVLATEGELVGELKSDAPSRVPSSQNIQEVPQNHIAVKSPDGRNITFVKIQELIGKIQN